MGGFFAVASKESCVLDLFFGTDYHSHLGTRRGGMAVYGKKGFDRAIHNIQNSPFRTKFERDVEELEGNLGIGCISDYEPQPLLVHSHLGSYAITTVGKINNIETLVSECFEKGHTHFLEMSGGTINPTEVTAGLINQKASLVEGLRYVQEKVEGSLTVLILTKNGFYVSRDKLGRTPVIIGKKENAFCASFESFAYLNLGYVDYKELGPAEIVYVTPESVETVSAAKEKMKICSFLWSYYGYPTSTYEGVNVEIMRYRNGEIMAKHDEKVQNAGGIDYVGGVPDSGTPHAIGYANASHLPFARAFIKYTPTWARSFTPQKQTERTKIAKMKQVPVNELITDKNLLFVDDSIVRGTQLKGTVDFLYSNGAKSVHMRSACPPIMYSCKYLNFSRNTSDMDLIARRVIMELEGEDGFKYLDEYADGSTERGKKFRKTICEKMHFDSLEYQTLEGMVKAIGIEPCKICTYCWNGKED